MVVARKDALVRESMLTSADLATRRRAPLVDITRQWSVRKIKMVYKDPLTILNLYLLCSGMYC